MVIAEPGTNSATMTGQLGLSELRNGDVLAGRFRIESMLGIGGMGVVYRAFDQSLDIPVAIKLLRPELARRPEAFERFRTELLLARQVSSPHVVRIHDIAQHEGRWFISMDFIDGESLERRMDDAGKLPVEDAIAITHDLLDGLTAAEQRGVVHRDLKPANVLLDANGAAFITDFGVARSLGATGATGSGVIVGTPEYLSPEQARGDPVDTRSDLYTVGLIIYEMLTGTLPFSIGTPAENVMQRIVRPPPSLAKARPDLPRWLHSFVDRLLKLNPAHRFASAQEALRALEARRVPRPPLDRRLFLIAALFMAVVAGGVDWYRRHPAAPPAPVAAVPVATPQWALMPVAAAEDASRPLARAFEEHVHAWLRTDREIGVVPRRRVAQARARTAPDASGASLERLLPDIAAAASAAFLLHGELARDAQGFTLTFSAGEVAGKSPPLQLVLHGGDAASLYTDYAARMPQFLAAAGAHVAAIPALPAVDLTSYGAALLELDAKKPDVAAQRLATAPAPDPASALLASARLTAAEEAGQDAPAQNERDAILKEFAGNTSPFALELRARALDGNAADEQLVALLTRAVHDYPHDAALIIAHADALRAHGEGAQALLALKRYVATNPDDARAWFLLGRTAIEQSDARAAVEDYLLHAQTLNTLARDSAGEAETRNAIGIGYERLGELDAAVDEYERAVAMRERLGDKPALAKSLRNLAIAQAKLGRRTDAERTLMRVKGILETLGDRASLATLYNDRGVVAEEGGDFGEALSFYRQAYAIRQQLDDPVAIGESLNNVGYASYRMGDYDNATAYWTQALALYQKLDDRNGILHIQQNNALLQSARGQFAAARQSLTDTLHYAEEHQLTEEAAVANVSVAELALLEGRYAAAQDFVEQATKGFARRADNHGSAEAALIKARIALALGDTNGAGTLLAAINGDQLNQEQAAEFRLASAQHAGMRGDRQAQSAQLDLAAAAAAKAHSGEWSMRIEFERTRAALANGDPIRAAKLLAELSKQSTRLNEVPLRLEWLELEIAAALRAGNAAGAIGHYREALSLLKTVGRYADAGILHTLGEAAYRGHPADADAAHAAAEAARAQLLADAPATVRPLLDAELARRLRELWEPHR